jgi:cell division protein FtsN
MMPISGTYSEAEKAAMRMSGLTPEMIAANHLRAKGMNPDGTPLTRDNTINKTELNHQLNQDGIYFKIQIGAFRKHTREIVQKRLERKTDKTMLTSYDDLTWLRFFMGSEHQYQSAKNLRETLQQAGFDDAFIVAFRNNKPMNLTEAIQLSNKAEVTK